VIEIQPVLPSFPVVKPKKIKKDEQLPRKRQNSKEPEAKKQDAEPIQHIDEIV
jgi:hypothetical protein